MSFNDESFDPNDVFVETLIDEKILTLKSNESSCSSKGIDLNLQEEYLTPEIMLYRFELGVSKVTYPKSINKITFNSNSCKVYVLAIDFTKKKKYRLRGFEDNDLMNLLFEYKKDSDKSHKKMINQIKKNTWVDFRCVYKSLKKGLESECVMPCSTGKPAHSM